MLSLTSSVRIFVCTQPTDMRRGFDGLGRMVEDLIKEDPFSGHLFVFINRRQDRTKILYWDRDGFGLWYKRLEQGTFRRPTSEAAHVEMTPTELSLLLGGIDLAHTRRRKRYRKKN